MGYGSILSDLLKQKKMTVTELSNITGISRSTLYAIINRDSNNINYDSLNKITDALGSDYAAIIDIKMHPEKWEIDSKKDNKLQSPAKRMSNIFDKLNTTGQTKAIEQVELLTKIPEYQKKKENESPDNILNNPFLTIAAHHEGDKYTEAEIKKINEFVAFAKAQKNKKNNPES